MRVPATPRTVLLAVAFTLCSVAFTGCAASFEAGNLPPTTDMFGIPFVKSSDVASLGATMYRPRPILRVRGFPHVIDATIDAQGDVAAALAPRRWQGARPNLRHSWPVAVYQNGRRTVLGKPSGMGLMFAHSALMVHHGLVMASFWQMLEGRIVLTPWEAVERHGAWKWYLLPLVPGLSEKVTGVYVHRNYTVDLGVPVLDGAVPSTMQPVRGERWSRSGKGVKSTILMSPPGTVVQTVGVDQTGDVAGDIESKKNTHPAIWLPNGNRFMLMSPATAGFADSIVETNGNSVRRRLVVAGRLLSTKGSVPVIWNVSINRHRSGAFTTSSRISEIPLAGGLPRRPSLTISVNAKRQIVGTDGCSCEKTGPYIGFIVSAGTVEPLTQVVSSRKPWVMTAALSINNQGKILATGHLWNECCRQRILLLTPMHGQSK